MTLLLLDGHNLFFRSFVTLPMSIVDGDGRPINAVYGLVAAILRLTRELEPTHIVATFDEPSVPMFRHKAYPAYQGHRGPLGGENAVEFQRQVSIARQVLPRLGVPAPAQPGYEADDVIATLATRNTLAGARSVIVSTDRDLLQLVTATVEILVPGAKPLRIRDAADVEARLGVAPDRVTTLKALSGDPSDNIPGVKGIGVKTAQSLVRQFGTLEAIYAHTDSLTKRVAQALSSGREDAFLFRSIVTLVTDLDIILDVASLPNNRFSPDAKVRELLAESGYGPPSG